MLRLPEHKEVNIQRNRPGGKSFDFHRDGLFLGKVIEASFTGVYIGDECKRKNSRRLVRVKWLCQTIRV